MIIHRTQKTYLVVQAVLDAKHRLFLLCILLCLKQASFSQEPVIPHGLPATAAWQQHIFVHVNKTFFVAGERAWFSVFATNVSNQPTDLEKIAFIEIFDQQQPVLQTTLPLQQGRGWGAWPIPDTLPTGNYVLRAYTNAMKNIGQATYFETSITIVNTSRQPSWAALEASPLLQLQLIPEGGKLVAGLQNITAVRCTNQYGEGLDASGAVLNRNKDTVARFVTCCGGRAVFTWTPKKGEQYTVSVWTAQQAIQTVSIPQPHAEGVTLAVKAAGAGRLAISAQASDAYSSQILHLIAGSDVYQLQLQDGKASITLDEEKLPGGLINFLLYDENGNLHGSRWWYHKPNSVLNIDVQLAAPTFGFRQEVKVNLLTRLGNGKTLPADLSVSVFRVDSLQSVSPFNINTPAGSEVMSESFAETDLLCRTMGPPWNSDQQATVSFFPVTFLPQFEGPQVLAMATDQQTLKPAAGIKASLSVTGKQYQFISAVSDSSGMLRFNLKNFTGSRKLVLSPGTNSTTPAVRVLSFFDPRPPVRQAPRFRLPQTWADQLQEHSLASQLALAFNTAGASVSPNTPTDTTAFFGLPDKSYLLDDYTRFPTLEEVLREYVPEVMVRKRDNSFNFRVLNEPYKQYFDQNPLVLADGVPVDVDAIMATDPLKIKKLDVITRRYAKALEVYDGIISFSTYTGNLDGMPLPSQVQLFEMAGSLPGQIFGPVAHNTATAAKNRIPDRRLQLCWLPSLHSDNNGIGSFSFFTSNVPGKYAIVFQGLGSDGAVGSYVQYFEVKEK